MKTICTLHLFIYVLVLVAMRIKMVAPFSLTSLFAPKHRLQSSTSSQPNPPPPPPSRKSQMRTLRLQNVGLPKAVDPGVNSLNRPRPIHTYNPLPFTNPVSSRPLPPPSALFHVLGIETSCDDTAAAIVSSTGEIVSESIASQKFVHANFGGVVPNLAKESHSSAIDDVVGEVLSRAGLSVDELGGVACTIGPGLEVCLRVGFHKARDLVRSAASVPFVGCHHLEEHILMATLPMPSPSPNPNPNPSHTHASFPFLALLVSGGHCQILKCYSLSRYEVVGGTIDDSLGECYDKVARMLGVDLTDSSTTLGKEVGSGGEAVEVLARNFESKRESENENENGVDTHTKYKLTVPMVQRKDCEFSFAGLKNNFRMLNGRVRGEMGLRNETDSNTKDGKLSELLGESVRCELAASFQDTAIRHLEDRVGRAIGVIEEEEGETFKQLVIVGGVAANKEIRRRVSGVAEGYGWKVVVPDPKLCTDNGVMAAWAGVLRIKEGSADDVEAQEVYARYPFAALE
ncbi:hypothetical protein ScalyP_jg6929 [Parmales sp. scaly parma]|nr:hypothetical protein ScalyP_jg6929 [Parmales sp. scaly parma]